MPSTRLLHAALAAFSRGRRPRARCWHSCPAVTIRCRRWRSSAGPRESICPASSTSTPASGSPETREFVRQRARTLDIPYYEVGRRLANGDHEYRLASEEYEHLIAEYGSPGPGAHRWIYTNLKEKPLQRFLSERDGPITLVSGIRRGESDRRMEHVDEGDISEYLGHPVISPLVDFTGLDVRHYRNALRLPLNPVSERLEMSVECLYGTFATRGELRMVRLFYPAVYRRILCLEAMVGAHTAIDESPEKTYGQWGHTQLKDREQAVQHDDQQMLLCESYESSCIEESNRRCE